VVPAYLLSREVFGDGPAWLGTLLLVAHPVLGEVAANALSDSSLLLFWTWGLWSAIRFLREGRFLWLGFTVAFGVLAYLSRPEGLLLPLVLAGTLCLLPLHRAARINWPRWRAALALLALGSLLLAGPYILAEGGIGTKPAFARVLGLAPAADAQAIERERPLPAGQTLAETYRQAVVRLFAVLGGVVPLPLAILAGVGLVALPPGPARVRNGLLIGILLAATGVGLVRLHATGGYATPRHALIPGSLLLLAAAHGFLTLASRITIPGSWLGFGKGRYRPGPAVWAPLLAAVVLGPRLDRAARPIPGPFNTYRDTALWLGENAQAGDEVFDMTDWSLYLSGLRGIGFTQLEDAPTPHGPRWVVAAEPHLNGHARSARTLESLIGDREPVIRIPARPAPGQLQVLVYDRRGSGVPGLAAAPGSPARLSR
jgi:hypothetical protein